jgi:hypothetical protein
MRGEEWHVSKVLGRTRQRDLRATESVLGGDTLVWGTVLLETIVLLQVSKRQRRRSIYEGI